uniref:Uncharacterized protein n=1 Tax=Anguilla anguilla TaxID=7936 RepID=A0A0E9X5A0_ANGAN
MTATSSGETSSAGDEFVKGRDTTIFRAAASFCKKKTRSFSLQGSLNKYFQNISDDLNNICRI